MFYFAVAGPGTLALDERLQTRDLRVQGQVDGHLALAHLLDEEGNADRQDFGIFSDGALRLADGGRELLLGSEVRNSVTLSHARHTIGIPIETQAAAPALLLAHTDRAIAHNRWMEKLSIGQVLAKNIYAAAERAGIDTGHGFQTRLAKLTGVSQGSISEILNCVVSPSINVVEQIADGLKVQPWELLADSETTRKAALARLLWNEGASDAKVEKHLPPAPRAPEPPKKKPPRSRKKRPRQRPGEEPR